MVYLLTKALLKYNKKKFLKCFCTDSSILRFNFVFTVARFQRSLVEAAKKETNIDLPIDLRQAINAVTLQILRKPANLPPFFDKFDEIGQYNKRKDMAMIYESPRGDITIHDLYALAKSNAVNQAPSGPIESSYIIKQGNNILVTGQAGIGKTTLTKMITKLLLENEIPDVEAKYIIYIKVRKIDFDRKCNIVEFLESCEGFYNPLSEEDIDLLSLQDFKELNNSSNVALIFDGLDEANTTDFKTDSTSWNPTRMEKTFPSVIVKNIMQGNVLPKAKKLWTSRQRQAYEIHENVRPHTIVQILGLDKDAQEDLGKQLCSEEGWPHVKKYLEDHPDLQVICYVPVICIIAISSIHSSLVHHEDIKLYTMTDVLAYALDLYSRSPHLRDGNLNGEMSKIPVLAWDSFLNEKIIFDEQDLQQAGIKEQTFSAFLITAVDKKTNFRLKLVVGDKKSSFSHLIWHEMFTAIKGVMFLLSAELATQLPDLLKPRWEVVAKLMYGLCYEPTVKRLRKIFDKSCLETDISQNRELLKNFLRKQVIEFRNFDPTKLEEKTQKLIQVCTWAQESNSSDFVAVVQDELPKVVDVNGDLLPSDVRCITSVLPNRHAIRVGANVNVRFIANSLLLLCSEIERKRLQVDCLRSRYW